MGATLGSPKAGNEHGAIYRPSPLAKADVDRLARLAAVVHWRAMCRAILALPLLVLLLACETTNSGDWTGSGRTPFGQAERSCSELLDSISQDEGRREFFIGCMDALGWTPKPGASIAI